MWMAIRDRFNVTALADGVALVCDDSRRKKARESSGRDRPGDEKPQQPIRPIAVAKATEVTSTKPKPGTLATIRTKGTQND